MGDISIAELGIDTAGQPELKIAKPYKTDYLSRIVPITSDQVTKIVGGETNQNVPTELLQHLQSTNHEGKIKFSVRVNELKQTSILGELSLSPTNRLIVVLEPNFDKSDKYKKFLQRQTDDKLTEDEKFLGFIGQKESGAIRARHILLTDETTHNTVDISDIFPEVASRYAPDERLENSEYDDGKHATEKLFTIGNLTESDSPILAFMGKCHEIGHRAMEIQTPPEEYIELGQLMEEAKAAGKPVNLEPEKRQRLKELLSENEVGSWMHALIIKKDLEKKGVVLDVADEDVIDYANEKLDTYEQAFGGRDVFFKITDETLKGLL